MSAILATTLLVLGVLIFLTSLDDLIVDLLSRLMLGKSRIGQLPIADTPSDRKPSVAIFVANWHEADVLGPMVERNLANFSYGPLKFILGVYPNDTETRLVADSLARKFPNWVEVVVNRRSGPTSKGQMLNEMFAQVFAAPETAPDLCVLHDSEDVIAPRSFDVYAREAPSHAMIQIPVFSIESRGRSLVGATYMDEFAERHTRELILREWLGAFVPSAGVGTCLRKDLIFHFLDKRGYVLEPASVTEDYVLGAEAHQAGFKTTFAAFKDGASAASPKIATLEYFPKEFWASVKQRTRWTYGVGFDGTKRLGWTGSWWNRFFLYRDRKGIVANFLPFVSMLLLALCLAVTPDFGQFSTWQRYLAWAVLSINTLSIAVRIYFKALALREVYGTYDVVGLVARWPVAMLINAVAVGRAWRSFLGESRLASRPIAWAKTHHELPAVFGFINGSGAAPAFATARPRRTRPVRSPGHMAFNTFAAACNIAVVLLAGGFIHQVLTPVLTDEEAAHKAAVFSLKAIDERERRILVLSANTRRVQSQFARPDESLRAVESRASVTDAPPATLTLAPPRAFEEAEPIGVIASRAIAKAAHEDTFVVAHARRVHEEIIASRRMGEISGAPLLAAHEDLFVDAGSLSNALPPSDIGGNEEARGWAAATFPALEDGDRKVLETALVRQGQRSLPHVASLERTSDDSPAGETTKAAHAADDRTEIATPAAAAISGDAKADAAVLPRSGRYHHSPAVVTALPETDRGAVPGSGQQTDARPVSVAAEFMTPLERVDIAAVESGVPAAVAVTEAPPMAARSLKEPRKPNSAKAKSRNAGNGDRRKKTAPSASRSAKQTAFSGGAAKGPAPKPDRSTMFLRRRCVGAGCVAYLAPLNGVVASIDWPSSVSGVANDLD